MSSDLPDTRPQTSLAFARLLASYMDCPDAIRSRILEDFDRAPAHRTIERLRAEHLASLERPQEAAWKAHEGYYPHEVSRNAEEANARFLRALRAERAASEARALCSSYLNNIPMVNQAIEREVARAKAA